MLRYLARSKGSHRGDPKRRGFVLRRLTLTCLLVFALLAPASTWASQDQASSFGSFAGYVWFGHLNSVHGSWMVPRVLQGSPAGVAGTWIGAQSTGGPHAFVQIGTSEGGVWPMSSWSQTTPIHQVATARARFAAALRSNIHALSSTAWPTPIAPLITKLIQASRALRAQTDATPQMTISSLDSWKARWEKDGAALGGVVHRLRRALHIPEITPSR